MVWRGAGAGSHAPGRSTAGAADEPDQSHDADEPAPGGPEKLRHNDEPYDADEPHNPDDYYESGCSGWSTLKVVDQTARRVSPPWPGR